MITNGKRLRYVCDECGESFVTARGFAKHAERDHPGGRNGLAASTRRWVQVEA